MSIYIKYIWYICIFTYIYVYLQRILLGHTQQHNQTICHSMNGIRGFYLMWSNLEGQGQTPGVRN